MSSTRLGICAVLLAFALGLGLFVWSALSTRRANTNANQNTSAIDMGDTPAIDITELTPPTNATIESFIDQGANAWIVGYDKSDPERIAYELFYEKLEPLAGGRVRLTKPQAWIYPINSGPIYIRAQAASFLRPPGSSEPESGRFYAGTKIELFHLDDLPAIQAAREKLGADLTAADLPPSMGALTTESLAFSSVAGEVSTRDPVHIIAPGLDVRFTGFKALIDEPGKRLAYFRADGAGFLKYDPAAARKANQRKNANNKPAASDSKSLNHQLREDLYRAEFRGPIRLASQGAALNSDILETWLRLIDGALPADAIFRSAANAKSQTNTTTDSSSATTASPSRASTLKPITLTWAGPFELRPLQQTPAELREDHLAARFSSPTSGVITLADSKSGASATGAALLTSATRGKLTLAGRGEKGVVLTAPDLAEVVGGSFSFDLPSATGAFHGPGVARLIGAAAAPDVPDPFEQTIAPEISWRHHCDLIFARDSAGAFNPSAPVLITEALFHDNVSVLHELATIDGDFLRAIFGANAAAKPALSRLIIDGGVAVNAHDHGNLIAKRIDALFDLTAVGTQAPHVVTAAGDVHATADGDELWAQLAEVHLAPANDNTVVVESFSADYDVIVKADSGPEAYADHLRASWIDETLELFGEPAIARYQDGSITAGSMRFNQHDSTLTVFGQSVFNYSQPRSAGIGYERVQVECSRSMRYDDRTGLAEFVGDCIATAEPDDFSRDVARGQRIALHFTPGALEQNNHPQQSVDTIENPETPTDPLDTERQVKLLSAVVYGWSNATADDGLAQVESRRYVADPTTESGIKLDRLAFLESAEIHLDATANTLTTPAAGRLLFEDRRASRQNENNNDNAIKTPRGTTLFEWDGDLFVNRAIGLARMTDRVRIRQRALESNTVTTLECAQLEAELAANNPPNPNTTGAPQVKRLTATGAVYAAQGERELIADRLIYNGLSNTAEAFAAPGNMVTLFQPNIPAPLTGSSLRWRLTDDRIEWFDAGETTTPQ